MKLSPRTLVILLALAVSFVNVVPLLLVMPGGDVVLNYAQVDCFARQIWEGILYPRWCMEANGGMGSPAPIFYFPLPFYIPAFFAPLKTIGFTTVGLYLIGVYLANVTAFLCCVLWLRKIISLRFACFTAFIFILSFYRAEMMARASYAEYWCIAFLPLLFMLVREACHIRWRTWPKLALVITICMFCHAPATVIGLMAAGALILIYGRGNWRALVELGIGCALAAMAGLFHYLPMRTLIGTLNDAVGGNGHWQRSWVNSFIDQPQLYSEHTWVLIATGIGFATAAVIFAIFILKRGILPDDARREGICWIIIAGIAGFMMLSISKPAWVLVEMLTSITTPWRMQALVMFALVYCFGILSEYAWFKKPHQRTGDMVLTSMFFILSAMFYVGGVDPSTIHIQKRLERSQIMIPYFSTRDMDKRYKEAGKFFEDIIDRPNREQAEWVMGTGALTLDQWDEHGIALHGNAVMNGTIRLEHFNYPIWQVSAPFHIVSEPIKGRMLISIPKGDFKLRLTQDFSATMPPYYRYTFLLSALSLAIMTLGLWSLRRRHQTSVETPEP